jgi:hypothetical protein
MNKNYALLAGGALLASTAITSAADAGSIRANAAVGSAPGELVAEKVANTLWASNSSGIDVGSGDGGAHFTVDLTGTYSTEIDLSIEFTGGSATGTAPTITYFNDAAGTLTAVTGVTAGTINVFPTRLFIDGTVATAGSPIGALVISGLTFTDAAGLATVGTSISVSKVDVLAGGTSTVAETFSPAAALITSASPGTLSVSAGSGVTIVAGSTIPFTRVGSGTGSLTATLATVAFTLAADVLMTDLSTPVTLDLLVSTVEIRLTHPVLGQTAAISSVQMEDTADPDIYRSVDAIQGTTVTFSPTDTDLSAPRAINVIFNGSVVIAAAAAGTLDVDFVGTPAGFGTTLTDRTGAATAALTLGGFTTEINTAQPSSNTFDSYVRITNQSTVSGAAIITVLNGNTGASLGTGTYTSASIAGGSTLQIGMDTIEAALGITPTAGVPYTIRINGPFNGYAQHIVFNSSNGFFGDLSGFRQGGSAAGTQNAP